MHPKSINKIERMQFFLRIKKGLFIIIYTLLLACGFYACASIGNPSGGDYDEEPPKFIGSNPAPNTTQYDKNKITLLFDEYISLEKPTETVIITPPQKKAPIIKAIGKKATVELNDTLLPNTTYTFDFTNGIVDYNERNALDGFVFAFSTGDVIDSLIISGLLLNAENLEPMPNIMVGIHSDLSDTAFTSTPFLRTSQTNQLGRFWIRNVAPGTYRVFALNDLNRDFKFDQPGEAIAFDETLIVPSFEPAVRTDTIWKDSLTVDTIMEINYTRFTPDDIFLRLFKEDFSPQYLSKTERTQPYQFVMSFNSEVNPLPNICLINQEESEQEWYILERSPDKKILTYWIPDSLLFMSDTLTIKADYQAHDTLNNLVSVTDTINLFQRRREASKEDEIERLNVDIAPIGTIDIYDTLRITFSEPVLPFDANLINFQQKVDTLWEKRELALLQDSLNPRVFLVDYKWAYGQEFQMSIDSVSISSIYDKWNDSIDVKFKIRVEDEYGHLYVKIVGNEGPGIGQLLDASERIVKESLLYEDELIFENIKPGKYFLRYIDDKNGNGKWDSGNYKENRQPEVVYYYSTSFDIKRYMEWEQTWNIMELPIEKQKPLEITKNKPAVKQPRRDDRRNENQRNSNTRMPGLSGF